MEEITKILKNLMSFKTIDGSSLEFDKLFEYIKSILPNNLYQTMYEFNNKKSLVISNSESKNLDLIICTHIDVVYGDDETMKYKEDETNIYGRGAIDMKGQVAVILSLIKNNTFNSLNAATTIIRLNNNIRTLKSRYDICGVAIKQLPMERRSEIISTHSFFKSSIKENLLDKSLFI